jgi:nicotinamide phosphoribosyltransferase
MTSWVNPLFCTDAYKLDHRRQYPENTSFVYSNFTPRGSRLPEVNKVCFFGMQAALVKLTEFFDEWFARDEDEVCSEYEEFTLGVLGPNSIGSDHIRTLHRKGYLPVDIRALPEGISVPMRVPVFTIENTEPEFFWLVNYLETYLSAEIWHATTSATLAMRLHDLLRAWAAITGDVEFVPWQGHDFSFRGQTCIEAAAASGAGHLVFFTGTDTLISIPWIKKFYPTESFIGGSVAATEHSVMCAGGQLSEQETFDRLLNLYPSGIVSVVSDTWDLWGVLLEIVPSLKDQIMSRDGKLVIRPDSGDPVKIICGDPNAGAGTPEFRGVCEILWDTFGGTVNEKGFKVLDPHIGMIYGDSINFERAEAICKALAAKGFATTNIVLGVGSFTYQYVTRDTFGFAMKATWAEVDGQGRDLVKTPKTDDGLKNSAKGRLAVLDDFEGNLYLIEQASYLQEEASLLVPIFRDGKFLVFHTFDDVRNTAKWN